MRRAIARPSQTNSLPIDMFGIPEPVLAMLNTRASGYGDACRLGQKAAELFSECLRSQSHLAGTGRLLAIARYIETHDCSHGIGVGFFDMIDKLLLRNARRDAVLGQALAGLLAVGAGHELQAGQRPAGAPRALHSKRLTDSRRQGAS
ncbi:hypothetical protein PQR29_04670 [Paraburkholderia strydomiana]|uniref:hypothetical protein n=1 Tax=Paraburkholderia strydomiana TaxID=1245417 RepID=UPI0038B92C69